MNTIKNIALASLILAVLGPTLAMAQESAPGVTGNIAKGIAALGAGIALIGGGFGIALIGKSANESVARQPEAGGRIFLQTIITAAFIEGATLFAVVVAIVAA